jgi:hypothetical protein
MAEKHGSWSNEYQRLSVQSQELRCKVGVAMAEKNGN